MNTKRKGMALEAKIMTDLLECGCGVMVPWGDAEKYDLLADVDTYMIRIQVKSARTRSNGETFEFDCRSNQYTSIGPQKHYFYSERDIDYFATAFDGQSYLVPVDECGSSKVLRLVPTKNNQRDRVALASEYELERVIQELRDERS